MPYKFNPFTGSLDETGATGATGPAGPAGPTGTVSAAGAGTAAAPSISFAADTNTGLFNPAADTLAFAEGGVEAMRIDSSSRLLVGTSSTSSSIPRLIVSGGAEGGVTAAILVANTEVTPTDGMALGVYDFSAANHLAAVRIIARRDGGTWTAGSSQPTRLEFSTTADGAASPTERMRITSGGDVIINGATSVAGARFAVLGGSATTPYFSVESTNTSAFGAVKFFNGNGEIGSISMLSTGVNYNTSSDYRLKENVSAVTDSINRLLQLKPSRFNFIADPDRTVDGFIAHEAQAVVPECATGEKDEVDDDGNPVYQGIDQAKLVPLLTAALQEAIAKIESLEARLTAAGI